MISFERTNALRVSKIGYLRGMKAKEMQEKGSAVVTCQFPVAARRKLCEARVQVYDCRHYLSAT